MRTFGGADRTSGLGGNISTGDPRSEKDPDPACPTCHGTGRVEGLVQVWGAKEGCGAHEWGEETKPSSRHQPYDSASEKQASNEGATARSESQGAFCLHCGALGF